MGGVGENCENLAPNAADRARSLAFYTATMYYSSQLFFVMFVSTMTIVAVVTAFAIQGFDQQEPCSLHGEPGHRDGHLSCVWSQVALTSKYFGLRMLDNTSPQQAFKNKTPEAQIPDAHKLPPKGLKGTVVLSPSCCRCFCLFDAFFVGLAEAETAHIPFLSYPKALRTHILRLLGPKTMPYRAFGLF